MKHFFLRGRIIILISCFYFGPISTTTFAQDDKEQNDSYKLLHARSSEDNTDNSKLQTLLKDESVKKVYDVCKTDEDGGQCIYDKLEQAGQLQDVLDKHFKKTEGTKPPQELKNKHLYSSLHSSKISQRSNSPEMKKLGEYLSKRLEEVLYGEINEKKNNANKVVDHAVFLELFEKQLGRNVIISVSSYCIEADNNNDFLISDDEKKREKTRLKNLKNLGKITTKQISKDSSPEKMSETYAQWNDCIKNIQKICHKTHPYDDSKKYSDTNKDYIYSKKRSCLVTNYIKGLRESLLATIETREKFSKLQEVEGIGEDEGTQVTMLTEEEKEKLTFLTSKEFAKDTKYSEESEKSLKYFQEKCKQNPKSDDCKKFLYSSEEREKLKEAVVELSLQRKLMETKLTETLKDEAELKIYLKHQGRTDEEIEELLEKKSADVIRKRIAERYAKERKSIIDSLKAQIDGKTDPNQVAKDKNAIPLPSSVPNPYKTIENELMNDSRRFTELLHFTNIIGGQLSLTDQDGKSLGRSLRTLKAELEESPYDDQDKNPNRYSKDQVETVKDVLLQEIANQDGSSQDTSGHTLGVSEINKSILDLLQD